MIVEMNIMNLWLYLTFFRDAGISAVTFHPSGHMVASSSFGGDFKVILDQHDFGFLCSISVKLTLSLIYSDISGLDMQQWEYTEWSDASEF